jgi:hypothetical protein
MYALYSLSISLHAMFFMLQELVSPMNKYYDITKVDSVSVILVFISIITILCIVYKLCGLLRKKCTVDEGTNAGVTL